MITFSRSRTLGQAIAIDGKRIRGANRHAATRYETATLVAHDTGLPLATLGFHDEGGETAAVRALLEQVPVAGRLLTIDALYTTRETARLLITTHGADYLMTVKKNAPETHQLLSTLDWERDATGHFQEPVRKAHGRIEQRAIDVLTPPQRLLNYPHVAQVFRITRRRTDARQRRDGATTTEHVYGFTSVPASAGHAAATARLEPRPLGRRGQPSHPRYHLRRRRLPRPNPLRPQQQRHLHQHRARGHSAPHPDSTASPPPPDTSPSSTKRPSTPSCNPESAPARPRRTSRPAHRTPTTAQPRSRAPNPNRSTTEPLSATPSTPPQRGSPPLNLGHPRFRQSVG